MASSSSSLPSSDSPEPRSPLPPSSPPPEDSNRDKRPRQPEDDDSDADKPARKTSRKSKALEEQIAYTGRKLGRMFHFCISYVDILEEGSELKLRDPTTLSDSETRKLKLYTALLFEYPNIRSDEQKCEDGRLPSVSQLLKKGTNSARAEDTNTLKGVATQWKLADIPAEKNMRGFNDTVCLKLLAPPNFPLDDLEIVEGIKSLKGPYALTHKHLPSFLYRNGVFYQSDPYKGLFLGEILIRAGLCILRGKEASIEGKGTRNTGKSVAERHKIRTITPAFIAYVATLLRFTLTNQTVWSNAQGSGWKYNSFYRQLLSLLEVTMTRVTLSKIILEWRSRIFGDCADSDDENDADNNDENLNRTAIPDLRGMLVAQANREKEEEAELQRQAEAEARRQLDAASRALRDATNAVGRR